MSKKDLIPNQYYYDTVTKSIVQYDINEGKYQHRFKIIDTGEYFYLTDIGVTRDIRQLNNKEMAKLL